MVGIGYLRPLSKYLQPQSTMATMPMAKSRAFLPKYRRDLTSSGYPPRSRHLTLASIQRCGLSCSTFFSASSFFLPESFSWVSDGCLGFVTVDFIWGCGSSTPDGSTLKDGCFESGLGTGLPIPVFAQSIPTWILPGRLSPSTRPFLALTSSRGRDWLHLFWLGGLDDKS